MTTLKDSESMAKAMAVQPVPEKLTLQMVNEMQIKILNGREMLVK